MALRKIARMGHPVLRRRAAEVADPLAPGIQALIRDMLETMIDAEGLGIAAPQVHDSRRVVMMVLINPTVEPLTEEREAGWEGCLSVPGLRGVVARPRAVRYRGVAPDGGAVDRTAEGLHARVVQHECDHLDGLLYPRRMDDLSSLTFESEWRRFAPGVEEDGAG